jgi:hypothetical protein
MMICDSFPQAMVELQLFNKGWRMSFAKHLADKQLQSICLSAK